MPCVTNTVFSVSKLRLRYQTVEFGDMDIHVRGLRDLQEFSDDDGEAEALGISSAQWSLFGVLWKSSRVLASLMARYEVDGKRILEVGCGLGLASLVLNHRGANITAMDIHPEAAAFLAENVVLNGGRAIPFVRSSWAEPNAELGVFDLIIGSDVLYEKEHVADLSNFAGRHLGPRAEIIVIDGGRNMHGRLRSALAKYAFVEDELQVLDSDHPGPVFAGRTMRYRRGFN